MHFKHLLYRVLPIIVSPRIIWFVTNLTIPSKPQSGSNLHKSPKLLPFTKAKMFPTPSWFSVEIFHCWVKLKNHSFRKEDVGTCIAGSTKLLLLDRTRTEDYLLKSWIESSMGLSAHIRIHWVIGISVKRIRGFKSETLNYQDNLLQRVP